MSDNYPVRYDVAYPERWNRLTVLFRIVLVLPMLLITALVVYAQATLTFAVLLMILFRGKYPRAWFDWQVEMARLSARLNAYLGYLQNEYPATDDQQSVTLEVDYPEPGQLSRGLPLIKWLLVLPHLVVLAVLGLAASVVTVIAWLAIIFAGVYPRGLFDFSVGVNRWGQRVSAYALWLTTDRYPPFSLS